MLEHVRHARARHADQRASRLQRVGHFGVVLATVGALDPWSIRWLNWGRAGPIQTDLAPQLRVRNQPAMLQRSRVAAFASCGVSSLMKSTRVPPSGASVSRGELLLVIDDELATRVSRPIRVEIDHRRDDPRVGVTVTIDVGPVRRAHRVVGVVGLERIEPEEKVAVERDPQSVHPAHERLSDRACSRRASRQSRRGPRSLSASRITLTATDTRRGKGTRRPSDARLRPAALASQLRVSRPATRRTRARSRPELQAPNRSRRFATPAQEHRPFRGRDLTKLNICIVSWG